MIFIRKQVIACHRKVKLNPANETGKIENIIKNIFCFVSKNILFEELMHLIKNIKISGQIFFQSKNK